MKIALISAMEKERQLILPLIEDIREEKLEGLKIFCGKLFSHDIIVAKCGIGKVNSAINTYKIIEKFHPDLLINTGVAGGASFNTKIGDLLVADYVAYHDVWCGPGTEYGVADGMDVFMECDSKVISCAHKLFDGKRLLVGLICSGDKFITSEREILKIRSNFPEVLAVDMESASIGQVCMMEGVPFNIIRVVSDTPGSGDNLEDYKNFWTEAPEKTFNAVKEIIKSL